MRAHKRVELTREQGKKYVKYDEGWNAVCIQGRNQSHVVIGASNEIVNGY